MKIGYARVSTKDQNLNWAAFRMQIDALKKADCEKIYQEKISGSKTERPQLNKLLENTRKGDVIVIWKLDRLGRSLKHLVQLVYDFMEKGVGLQSLNDPIDTTSPQGRLTFNIFASLAEFEREVIRERTMAGLSAARARDRLGGRPNGLSPHAQKTAMVAEALYKQGELSISEITKQLDISRSTLYRYLRVRGVVIGKTETPSISGKQK